MRAARADPKACASRRPTNRARPVPPAALDAAVALEGHDGAGKAVGGSPARRVCGAEKRSRPGSVREADQVRRV
jgi:hypothetical protein